MESYETFIDRMKTDEINFEKSSMSPSNKLQESSIFHSFPKKSFCIAPAPKDSEYDIFESDDPLDKISLINNESASIRFFFLNLIFLYAKNLKNLKT